MKELLKEMFFVGLAVPIAIFLYLKDKAFKR